MTGERSDHLANAMECGSWHGERRVGPQRRDRDQIGDTPQNEIPVWISMVGVAIHEWTASPWRTELEEAGTRQHVRHTMRVALHVL